MQANEIIFNVYDKALATWHILNESVKKIRTCDLYEMALYKGPVYVYVYIEPQASRFLDEKSSCATARRHYKNSIFSNVMYVSCNIYKCGFYELQFCKIQDNYLFVIMKMQHLKHKFINWTQNSDWSQNKWLLSKYGEHCSYINFLFQN